MKAIETRYKGYRFRSRLEARWAVFFDAVKTPWEYEPEGYDLGTFGWYLTDFFLPDLGIWIEVKPNRNVVDQDSKLIALVEQSGYPGMVVKGEPALACEPDCHLRAEPPGWIDGSAYWMHYPDGAADGPYIPCVCPWCFRFDFQYDGRGARVCGHKKHFDLLEDASNAIGGARADDKAYSNHYPQIVLAAQKARQARFEHGECPA